jgi:hypothetical protein
MRYLLMIDQIQNRLTLAGDAKQIEARRLASNIQP